MTLIDLEKQKLKLQAKEFKDNMDRMLTFCKATLNLVSSKDVAIIPQNEDGIKKLEEFLKVCRSLNGGKK